MTQEEYRALPHAQREAMIKLQRRSGIEWEDFLEKAFLTRPGDYVGVPDFHGMFVGIEPDGYTHS
jgi:hypothetical protein